MPSIDELKGTESGIPTLTQGDTTYGDSISAITAAKRAIERPISPGVTQGPSTNRIVPQGGAKGMIIQTVKGTVDERVEAHIAPNAVDEANESLGINKRESIVADVFGKDGPFSEYLKEKIADYQKDMDKFDADKESAEFEDQSSAQTSENEEGNKYAETTISEASSYRTVDIMKPKEKKNMGQEIETFTPDEVRKPEVTQPQMDNTPQVRVTEEDEGETLSVEGETPTQDDVDPYETEMEKEYEQQRVLESVQQEELEYAKPEAPADSYANAIEVESVKEETVPIQPKVEPAPTPVTQPQQKDSIDKRLNKITRSFMALPVEDEEKTNEVVTVDEDEDYNILKNLIKEKIRPISDKLDLSSFTITKKGTTSNSILSSEAAIAKWVLPNTGVTFQMREISGSNLENMRSLLERTPADNRGALKIIYDHIVSPKAPSFEKWLKSISFNDLNHLFMGVYISSFADSNYIPIDCVAPGCGKPYLSDNISIMDMVKFENDEYEKKFWDLYNSDIVEAKGLYVSEVVPISKGFAIGFKEPSLYDVMIESSYFNSDFVERYGQIVQYVPFIDTIYHIDYNNKSLVPIEWEQYSNNIARTARSKVQRYDKVINTMSADENAMIAAYIRKINEKTEWFTYQIPETTCPHCGKVTPATGDQQASALVFLRNRLALLATS